MSVVSEETEKTIIEGRKQKLVGITKRLTNNKSIICLFGLFLIILLGAYIRVQNLHLLKDKYTIELDTEYFLRIAKTINEVGYLPQNDTLRYAPLGFDSRNENNFLSYTMVYLYKFMHFFNPAITLEKAVILHPVIFFILGLLFFYFLVREFFDDYVALLASLFLAIIPAYLHRTMAGFSDKEALGLFFMYLAFFLFIKSVKEKKNLPSSAYALASGVVTGLMGLAWGGFKFSLIIIAAFHLVLFILGKISKRSIINYALWMIPFTVITSLFIGKYGGLKGLVTSSTSGLVYLVFGILVFGYFLNNAKRLDALWVRLPLPKEISILLFLLVLGSVATYLFIGQSAVVELFNDAKGMLLRGITNSRLGLTVAESKQPFVSDWLQSFGWSFLLFFVGVIMLFFRMVKSLPNQKTPLSILFTLSVFGMIFSRYASNSPLNGETSVANMFFFVPLALFLGYAVFVYFKFYFKDKEAFKILQNLDVYLMFIFIWLMVVVLAARGGIRLFIVFAPVLSIIVAFVVIQLSKFAAALPDKFYKLLGIMILIIITVPLIYANTLTSFRSAQYAGPSFNQQWQTAMEWVKEGTPKDAIFAHWWDYGYWVQTGGGRATITDGGNFIPYWNHLMGRHVLSARNETEALEFLYAHGATHLLIISDEIGKYTAYSSIGSDENFDIFSWISTFVMDPRSTRQENGTFQYYFSGGTALDDNLMYQDKIYPAKEAVIAGFIVPVQEYDDNESFEILQPKALLFYRSERTEIPVECVYHEGKKIFYKDEGLKGCLRIFPRFIDNRYQQENGALLYVSEKGMNALWAKLFLFNEKSPSFELVYDDSSMNQLAYYYGNIMGPLKIWRIHYPKNFTISQQLREEYLAQTTPEWMKLDGITI